MTTPIEAIIPATVGAVEGRFGCLLERGWTITAGGKKGERFARIESPRKWDGHDMRCDVSATGRDLLSAFNLLHKNCVAAGVLR